MLMPNNHCAVIGLDAQLVSRHQTLDEASTEAYSPENSDIDKLERLLYLGDSLGNSLGDRSGNSSGDRVSHYSSDSPDNSSYENSASALAFNHAIKRMAQANKIATNDIEVIVVCQQRLAFEQSVAYKQLSASHATHLVSSLAKALTLMLPAIDANKVVAIVGENLSLPAENSMLGSESETSATTLASTLATTPPTTPTLATISFDQNFTHYQSSTGFAALLFASTSFVEQNNSYVYAWLTGCGLGNTATDKAADIVSQAFTQANIQAKDVGLVEVSALANKALCQIEIRALVDSYQDSSLNSSPNSPPNSQPNYPLNTAVTCARSIVGECGGFSQVLGLLRSVIALQQRYIPAVNDWQQPIAEQLAQWQASHFYFPTEARPWYPEANGNAHHCAYSCLSENADYCHVILTENKVQADTTDDLEQTSQSSKHPASDIRLNGFIANSPLKLILIASDSEQDLLAKLTQLAVLVTTEQSLKAIASQYYHDYLSMREPVVDSAATSIFTAATPAAKSAAKPTANKAPFTLALLCESKDELQKEILLAKAGVVTAFEKQQEWRTPKGSYFTPEPVNTNAAENNVSFLYPGIGATYVGLGRDLFHLFPEIHQDIANLADDIGASLKDTLLNPRTIIRPDFATLKQLDLNLRGNLADIAEAGVGFACVFTKVFENVFKVKADYATGYSMGEVSMYAALGAWQQPGLMSARLANSDTFNHRLCGELLTLREHWGLEDAHSSANPETIWETYTIKANLDDFLKASEGEERVYCTIINTPDSLLVAGYPEDCLRVIKKLGVRAMALNMANAIHSEPANKEYNQMVELYSMAVTERLKTKMYSSSCYLPVPQLSKAIAHSVAKCLCDRVDFPRLINTMYDKGARVFIEMGPGRSLCSWVDKILDFEKSTDKKSRVSVPVNAKGTSDELTYFRAIAKLTSHGVTLDLHTLFNGSIIVAKD